MERILVVMPLVSQLRSQELSQIPQTVGWHGDFREKTIGDSQRRGRHGLADLPGQKQDPEQGR